jgi:hypothetical protein
MTTASMRMPVSEGTEMAIIFNRTPLLLLLLSSDSVTIGGELKLLE